MLLYMLIAVRPSGNKIATEKRTIAIETKTHACHVILFILINEQKEGNRKIKDKRKKSTDTSKYELA